jgi:hypothetical protein
MSLPPLTHHEVLTLVEPYTRRGRRVDLAASDRLTRRLVFKPLEHGAVVRADAGASSAPADKGQDATLLTDTLVLDQTEAGRYRLTRTLRRQDGLEAELLAEGPHAGQLLEGIESIAPHSQFAEDDGIAIAHSHRLPGSGKASPDQLVLTRGTARIDGLTLTLTMPTVAGEPAELSLGNGSFTPPPLDLPEDLFAVLGWAWSRLTPKGEGWQAALRLPKSEPARSRQAEQRLLVSVRHLAAALAEPPARFHDRHVAARWRVAARRSVPALACMVLIGGSIALARLDLAQDSVVRMLLFNAPPLLLIAAFCLRETPRIEIPPLPRASRAASWYRSAPAPTLDHPTAPR